MMQGDALVLRDIHQPPAPPWWPPAPGWWLVMAGIALLACGAAWLAWRRRHRARRIASLFDARLAQAQTPAEEVAAMSELLRRAARRQDPNADKLLGDDWLRFLDTGLQAPVFSTGAGAILRDGGYRRDVSPQDIEAVRVAARTRFLDWMASP
jgi:LPXTG-motif cell wall-anchored protein